MIDTEKLNCFYFNILDKECMSDDTNKRERILCKCKMVQPTIIILYLLSPPLYWSLSHNVDNIMQRLVEIQHSLNLIIPGVIIMSIQITKNLLFSSMKIGQRQ